MPTFFLHQSWLLHQAHAGLFRHLALNQIFGAVRTDAHYQLGRREGLNVHKEGSSRGMKEGEQLTVELQIPTGILPFLIGKAIWNEIPSGL